MASGSTEPRSLNGVRVLLLEDEVLVSLDHRDMLEAMGCIVTECARLSDAISAMEQGNPDIGLLDVNIGGEMSYAIAEVLEERGVPVAFVTSYQSPALDGKWRDYPICVKPCASCSLVKLHRPEPSVSSSASAGARIVEDAADMQLASVRCLEHHRIVRAVDGLAFP